MLTGHTGNIFSVKVVWVGGWVGGWMFAYVRAYVSERECVCWCVRACVVYLLCLARLCIHCLVVPLPWKPSIIHSESVRDK